MSLVRSSATPSAPRGTRFSGDAAAGSAGSLSGQWVGRRRGSHGGSAWASVEAVALPFLRDKQPSLQPPLLPWGARAWSPPPRELLAGARFRGGGHAVQPPGPLAPYLGEPLPRVWRAGRARGRQALAPGFATRPPTSVLPSRRRWPLPLPDPSAWPLPLPTLLPGPSRRWQRCQVKLRMPRETWVSAGPQMRFNCEWVQV